MRYDIPPQKQMEPMQRELGESESAEMQQLRQISAQTDQHGIRMEQFRRSFDNFLGKTSEMDTLFSMPQKAQVQMALL